MKPPYPPDYVDAIPNREEVETGLKTIRKRLLSLGLVLSSAAVVTAQGTDTVLPEYLKDRGTGIATPMFGTYIRPGELIIYPFGEYYPDNNFEYSPVG